MQLAASGGELGVSTVVPVAAFAALAVSWLVADEAVPQEKLSKVGSSNFPENLHPLYVDRHQCSLSMLFRSVSFDPKDVASELCPKIFQAGIASTSSFTTPTVGQRRCVLIAFPLRCKMLMPCVSCSEGIVLACNMSAAFLFLTMAYGALDAMA